MTQESREIPIFIPILRNDIDEEEEDVPEHENFKYTLLIDQEVNQTLSTVFLISRKIPSII